MRRRFFIKALGTAAAGLIVTPIGAGAQMSGRSTQAQATDSLAKTLREAYDFGAEVSWPAGAIPHWAREEAAEFLTQGLSRAQVASLIENPGTLAATMTERIRRDESAGTIINVQGWTITKTEAAIITLTRATEAQSA